MATEESSIPTPTKRCTKCGEEKPWTAEYFAQRGKGVLYQICKPCFNARMRERYAQDPTGWKARHARYYGKNQTRIAKRQRLVRLKNQEHINDRRRKWRKKNRENCLLIARLWSHKRRSILRNLPYSYTKEHWQYAKQYWGFACAVCGNQEGFLWTLAMDHWCGVTNPACPGTVPWNIIPLCQGIGGCNNQKAKRDPFQWLCDKLGVRKARKKLKEIEAFLEGQRRG